MSGSCDKLERINEALASSEGHAGKFFSFPIANVLITTAGSLFTYTFFFTSVDFVFVANRTLIAS